jgi:F-type H+-transporting ATPase subunit epsilon
MDCRVLFGDTVLYAGTATMVVARSTGGEFAVMEGHEPMLAALAEGPLRIETGEGTQTFVLKAGTLRVAEDGVTVVASGVASAAEPASGGAEPGDA